MELYAIHLPSEFNRDHYRIREPYLAVYDTKAGKNEKPIRTFPVPRQITVMQTGQDGSLYLAGAYIYKMDVNSGEVEVAIPSRNWKRPLYSPPNVLYAWPIQTPQNEFTILYTTARFKDQSYDLNTADWLFGYFNVDLETGKTETTDFGPLTEIYFSGMRSPIDDNMVYGVLNHLAKYDINKKELVKSADLEHSYYCISMSHDGSKVYLSGTFNDIAVFDADSLKQLGKIELPGGDMAISTAQIFIR